MSIHHSRFSSADFFLYSDMLFQFFDGQKWIQEEIQFTHEILKINKWDGGL